MLQRLEAATRLLVGATVLVAPIWEEVPAPRQVLAETAGRPVRLLVVDAIELVRGTPAASRAEEEATIARELKRLARDLDAPHAAAGPPGSRPPPGGRPGGGLPVQDAAYDAWAATQERVERR